MEEEHKKILIDHLVEFTEVVDPVTLLPYLKCLPTNAWVNTLKTFLYAHNDTTRQLQQTLLCWRNGFEF